MATPEGQREANTYAQVASMLGLSNTRARHTALLDLMISKLFTTFDGYRSQRVRAGAVASTARSHLTQVAGQRGSPPWHGRHTPDRLAHHRPTLYSSGKLLLQSQVLIRLLENADISGIAYFSDPSNGRARTRFFTSIARLLYLKLRETPTDMRYEQFWNFMNLSNAPPSR